MPQIIQYRPAYFSGFKNKKRKFNSLRELLNIEWVDNFRKLPNGQIDPNFYQYSIDKYSNYKGYEYILMAEYKNGYSWAVVGYIDENKIIKDLPAWVAKYEAGS